MAPSILSIYGSRLTALNCSKYLASAGRWRLNGHYAEEGLVPRCRSLGRSCDTFCGSDAKMMTCEVRQKTVRKAWKDIEYSHSIMQDEALFELPTALALCVIPCLS